MTFAVLRALHAIIGDAIQDIERVYAEHNNLTSDFADHRSPSPTPTPSPLTPSSPCYPVYPYTTSHAEPGSNSSKGGASDLHSIVENNFQLPTTTLGQNKRDEDGEESRSGGLLEGAGLGAPFLLKTKKPSSNQGLVPALGTQGGKYAWKRNADVSDKDQAETGSGNALRGEIVHKGEYASPPRSPSFSLASAVPATPGTPLTRVPQPSGLRTPKSLRASKSLALLSLPRPSPLAAEDRYPQALPKSRVHVGATTPTQSPPGLSRRNTAECDPSTPPGATESHSSTSDSNRKDFFTTRTTPSSMQGLPRPEHIRLSQLPCSPRSPLEGVFTFPSSRSRSSASADTTQQPSSPFTATSAPSSEPPLDFPSLEDFYDPNSPAEILNATHPVAVAAIARIVAAAGQLGIMVQSPFLSICDAVMGYNLAACMRFLEATHTVEVLRDSGSRGMPVKDIAKRCSVDPNKLAHILRLVATHHIICEVAPDVFALNRISSLMDTGKDADFLLGNAVNESNKAEYGLFPGKEELGSSLNREPVNVLGPTAFPEKKYEGTNGIAAFVGMCTDELFKSSSYMTEAYLLSPHTKYSRDPIHAPFNFAFGTSSGFFAWLEGEAGHDISHEALGIETGPGSRTASMITGGKGKTVRNQVSEIAITANSGERHPFRPRRSNSEDPEEQHRRHAANRFRLERFGKAMVGTGSWEAPGAILNGFDWASLPPGSTIVDVGGGIGSTSMLLANAFAVRSDDGKDLGMKFIIQDRPIVVEMGEKAWRARCPELLDSGTARFQVHDFFTPQPIINAAVFLLRVVLHDWPDTYAAKILLRLRGAATESTKLIIADFVLPLACVDDFGVSNESGGAAKHADGHMSNFSSFSGEGRKSDGTDVDQITDNLIEGVEGARRMLAPPPLLANLGKASANAYWMDLTMQVTFNSQERTLREIVALAFSAGWKVIKVTHAVGSLFGHIVAVPVPIPRCRRAQESRVSAFQGSVGEAAALANDGSNRGASVVVTDSALPSSRSLSFEQEVPEIGSRCGTPTFGSRVALPSIEETLSKLGGRYMRGRSLGASLGRSIVRPASSKQSSHSTAASSTISGLPIGSSVKVKHRPSPLSVPSPVASPKPLPSPRLPASPSISRRSSFANLHRYAQSQSQAPAPVHESVTLSRTTTTISRPRSSTMISRQPTPVGRQTPSSLATMPRQVPPVPPVPALPRLPSLPVSNRLTQPPSPITSRHTRGPITRRLSHATLTQIGAKKQVDGTLFDHKGSTNTGVGESDRLQAHGVEGGQAKVSNFHQARSGFSPESIFIQADSESGMTQPEAS